MKDNEIDDSEVAEMLNKETKQQYKKHQEEHWVKIRDQKQKQLLQKSRKK